ncbi:MAG: hypothetical protein AVDCRST_MAG25-2006, partial [uncultured Rubrobacteraceae bacterium]
GSSRAQRARRRGPGRLLPGAAGGRRARGLRDRDERVDDQRRPPHDRGGVRGIGGRGGVGDHGLPPRLRRGHPALRAPLRRLQLAQGLLRGPGGLHPRVPRLRARAEPRGPGRREDASGGGGCCDPGPLQHLCCPAPAAGEEGWRPRPHRLQRRGGRGGRTGRRRGGRAVRRLAHDVLRDARPGPPARSGSAPGPAGDAAGGGGFRPPRGLAPRARRGARALRRHAGPEPRPLLAPPFRSLPDGPALGLALRQAHSDGARALRFPQPPRQRLVPRVLGGRLLRDAGEPDEHRLRAAPPAPGKRARGRGGRAGPRAGGRGRGAPLPARREALGPHGPRAADRARPPRDVLLAARPLDLRGRRAVPRGDPGDARRRSGLRRVHVPEHERDSQHALAGGDRRRARHLPDALFSRRRGGPGNHRLFLRRSIPSGLRPEPVLRRRRQRGTLLGCFPDSRSLRPDRDGCGLRMARAAPILRAEL